MAARTTGCRRRQDGDARSDGEIQHDRITRRRFTALALGAVAAPAIVGRALAAGVIKIGDIQSLTGPSAPYGIRARDGAILAIEAANAAGGFKDAKGETWRFEKIDADMANEAKQTLTLYRQFATDRR